MEQATLTGIYIYPIKSCRGIALDQATVSAIGLDGDRLWQVVDEEGKGLTQRQHKILATVSALPHGDGLRITADGMAQLDVSRSGGLSARAKSHFGVPVSVVDAGDDAADWFSSLTDQTVRLVAMAGESGWRLPDPLDIFGQAAPFTDAAPILVTSESSLAWLRERSSEDFEMDRFRPNLVISHAEPWEEDSWASFNIGSAQLRAVLPWPRCAIPQIDQMTATRHKEPAKVLREHRWCTSAPTVPEQVRPLVEGNGLFGIGCSINPAGAELALGAVVEVSESTTPVLSMA